MLRVKASYNYRPAFTGPRHFDPWPAPTRTHDAPRSIHVPLASALFCITHFCHVDRPSGSGQSSGPAQRDHADYSIADAQRHPDRPEQGLDIPLVPARIARSTRTYSEQRKLHAAGTDEQGGHGATAQAVSEAKLQCGLAPADIITLVSDISHPRRKTILRTCLRFPRWRSTGHLSVSYAVGSRLMSSL